MRTLMKNAGFLDKETEMYITDIVDKFKTYRGRYMKTKDKKEVSREEVTVPTNRGIPETLNKGSEKVTENKINEQEFVIHADNNDEGPTPVEIRHLLM